MYRLIVYCIIVLLNFGCYNEIKDSPINLKNSILFLENFPDAIGAYNMNFNKISFMNIDTKNIFSIGDNSDYITSVDFYGDSSIIFSGYQSKYSELLGTGPELQIFELNLSENKQKVLSDLKDLHVIDINNLNCFNKNQIIFSYLDNIFFLNPKNEFVQEITEFNIDELIINDSLEVALTINSSTLDSIGDYMLFVKNLGQKTELKKLYESENDIKLLNWMNNDLYFYCDSILYKYSLISDKINVFTTLPKDSIHIDEIKINSRMEIYLIGYPKLQEFSMENNIYKYDLNNRKFIQLTNTKSYKSNIRI